MCTKDKKMINFHFLLTNLIKREIATRYKQSILGYFWVIINPLSQMLVMTFVFTKIFRVQTWNIPYPLFVYAGLLPWILFTQSLSHSTNSIVGNLSLVKQIYFPREVLVLATILAKIVDFFLASIVFIIFMLYYRQPFHFSILWFVPIFIIQFVLTFGLSLILSAFNVFYRDVQYLLNLILLLWMYLTPIYYPVEMVPDKFRFIYSLNPMSVLINAYRHIVFKGTSPKLTSLGIAFLVSLVVFLVGLKIFKKLENLFADVG